MWTIKFQSKYRENETIIPNLRYIDINNHFIRDEIVYNF